MSREVIAEVLKERRKRLGLSVEMVSSRLKQYDIDVSPRSLYSYESGHRQPDADTLMALCEIYNIDNIMKEFGYTKNSPAPAEAETEEDARTKEYASRVIDALVSLGFLEEHKDLTPRQSLVVSAVLQILSVEFGQAESSTEYWGEAV